VVVAGLLGGAAPVAAQGEGPVVRRLNPPTLPAPTGYTQVVEARGGRMLWISGQVALDSTGALVGAGDVRRQVEQVYANLERALGAAGATFADVVKMTTYALDPTAIAAIREVRTRYLRAEALPASTFVAVTGLARPEWLVEIEVVAVVR
jgi:enamine deaminase RidA (YjgF/YER057c/UK114 family)